MRRSLIPAPLLVLALVAGPGAGAAEAPAGCVSGSAGAAARRLIHPGAEISGFSNVAGFRSALVLEPLVYPGVRHRLVKAGDYWCDAMTGFNSAWRLAGRSPGAVEMASAYARLAAAPYFDGVSVQQAAVRAPGLVDVRTHARTNGITAVWLVRVDGSGIRAAEWTATGLAVAPFEAEWEGVSALPGVHRTYARGEGGSLKALEDIVPEPVGAPETVTEGKTVDDFTIRLVYGDSGPSPNLGQDTGVDPIDRPRTVLKMLLDNYKEFHGWGFRKGWTSDVGTVYIDSSSAATCWACVYIREDFNIHLSSAITQILFALGWEYPNDKEALSTVIGHEMAHDWQNAYYKPTQNGASTSTSFSEGTARFQETIHSYSHVTHQPKSLVYSIGREVPGVSLAANSCNGWDGADIEASFAAGLFTGKSYNACYFWLSWYDRHGTSGLVNLFGAMRDHAKKTNQEEVIAGLKQAVGAETFVDDLAAFAQASITGKGYAWAPPGTTTVRDWGLYLDRWTPATLTGGQASKTLADGGVMARRITEGGCVSWTASQSVSVYAIRDTASGATRTLLAKDAPVAAPAEGERVWLVAVYPGTASTTATLKLGACPAA